MISILIPLYNGIEFLEECIFTVANQTYKEFECIVGINGHDQFSDTEITAREICYKYNKIIVKWYSTKGKENTLNEMVKDSKYNYIAVLDCDDKWELTKLAKQVPYLGLYDIIGTNCRYFGELHNSPEIPFGDYTTTHNFLRSNPVINSSVIIRKTDANWEDNFYGLDDYNMWLTLRYIKSRIFYNIPETLTYHRIHNNSSFNSKQNLPEFYDYWINKILKDEINKINNI
jgi:alpha-1,3-rhamnosyltransferase